MIPVTKPFLPPKEEYDNYLEGIWQRNWLTNHGPLVNELESKLKDYFRVENLLYLGNGTLALQLAIKALGLHGEIITTPFSYIATTSSIIWEGCKPIFVDIDPETLNIDPSKIEAAITPNTSGILATHVYGNPCEIEELENIASRNRLKLIFDAAHCFGTKYKGESVFKFGDISTASFHATKIFHTIEGGAVITKNNDLIKKLAYLRNFGHETPYEFVEAGINAKNSEFHAAMGLCVLNHINEIFEKRKLLVERYDSKLRHLPIQKPRMNSNSEWNFAYYPVIFQDESQLIRIITRLEKNYIYTRRYFFPSINNVNYLHNQNKFVNSESIASRILCLPMYHSLSFEEIDMISNIISKTI